MLLLLLLCMRRLPSSLQVERVHEGCRLTLTDTLHRDAPPSPTFDMLLPHATTFHNALAAALADKEFMPNGEAGGMLCAASVRDHACHGCSAELNRCCRSAKPSVYSSVQACNCVQDKVQLSCALQGLALQPGLLCVF
jgi:hypothetical protein